jgi:hypothetical protein
MRILGQNQEIRRSRFFDGRNLGSKNPKYWPVYATTVFSLFFWHTGVQNQTPPPSTKVIITLEMSIERGWGKSHFGESSPRHSKVRTPPPSLPGESVITCEMSAERGLWEI